MGYGEGHIGQGDVQPAAKAAELVSAVMQHECNQLHTPTEDLVMQSCNL